MSELSAVIVDDIHRQIVGRGFGGTFTSNQTAPGFMTLMDDLHCIFLVFGFSGEGKGIFWLAVGDLVNPIERKLTTLNLSHSMKKD
jgi:hypothetical protein